MSKKKGGKRLNKKQVAEMLQTLFQQNPNETFSFKQIFKALKLDTHPAKMLAVDVLDEMAWDDYLTKSSDNFFRLNLKTQVQEGTFIRKANGKNSFQPDDGGKPIFVSERNSLYTVNARLVFQRTVDICATDGKVDFFIATHSALRDAGDSELPSL